MPEPCPAVAEADFTALPIVLQETWQAGQLDGVEFAEGGLRLQGQPGYREEQRFPAAGWTDVVAMAIDRCDQIHLLDRGGRLWVYDPAQQAGETPPCALPLAAPSGLAVAELTAFVAAGQRVLALSRGNGQIRWIWDEASTDPGDLAVHADRLYVLDRAGRRVLVLSPGGAVLRQFGADSLVAPSRMTFGGDGGIYILDGLRIVRFDGEGTRLSPDVDLTPPMLPAAVSVASLAVDAGGVLYVGDGAARSGAVDARMLYRHLPGEVGFQPVFGYTGPAFHMAFDHHGNLLLVAEGGEVVRLKLVVTYRSRGAFVLKPLDSGVQNTHWHKLLLEGDRPQETSIAIQYIIRDDAMALAEAISSAAWSAPLLNFTDALVERAAGRFLALRGELTTNNPLTTPRLRLLTAVFPRQSYLRYLPPIYQDDPGSEAFLERFLSIFETLTGRLDGSIDGTPSLIDPAAAEAEFLPWLAGWLALSLEEGWSDAQRRRFLAEAMSLYKQRGTREGISRAVEAITRKPPMIIEPFQRRCIQDADLRQAYDQVYGAGDCHFCVLVDPQTAKQVEIMAMIRRMVEEQVPAHTQAGVLGLRPWFHLGMHTYLGINTHLTRPSIRLEESVLGGGETALIDREDAGQVERQSRIGVDTSLT